MIRNCGLEEISDGRLYAENDMVRADTCNCEGCKSVCCHGMGNSIVLDPYDIYRLTNCLNTTFEELLKDNRIEINYVDGIMLPNLKMSENTDNCTFLDENRRCAVHEARPGMCRLFPLGRYWEDENHFKYILQTGQCKKKNLSKIKVKKWLDTDNLAEYNAYVVMWHRYLKRIEAAVAGISRELAQKLQADGGSKKHCENGESDADSRKCAEAHKDNQSTCQAAEEVRQLAATQIKTICLYTLKTFFSTPYDERPFFEQIEERINSAYSALGME